MGACEDGRHSGGRGCEARHVSMHSDIHLSNVEDERVVGVVTIDARLGEQLA
jgi:hypothetical protein